MFFTKVIMLLVIPIIGSFFIYFARKNPNRREGVSFITAFLLFGIVLNLFNASSISGEVVHLVQLFPGVSVSFLYDHLSILFAFIRPYG